MDVHPSTLRRVPGTPANRVAVFVYDIPRMEITQRHFVPVGHGFCDRYVKSLKIQLVARLRVKQHNGHVITVIQPKISVHIGNTLPFSDFRAVHCRLFHLGAEKFSPVHQDCAARHKAIGIAYHAGYHVANVLRVSDPAQRDTALLFPAELFLTENMLI